MSHFLTGKAGWKQAYLSVVCVNSVQAKGEQTILGPNIKPLVALIQQHGLGLKRCSMSLKHPGPVQLPELCRQHVHTKRKRQNNYSNTVEVHNYSRDSLLASKIASWLDREFSFQTWILILLLVCTNQHDQIWPNLFFKGFLTAPVTCAPTAPMA